MIGVFDSGVGGLSVLSALRKKAPRADVVYFGDTENAPYGPKSKREIANLIGAALRRLHAAGATQIISACNSASVSVMSEPIDLLRLGVFDVIEMVDPTVSALSSRKKKVVALATRATEKSGIYQEAFKKAGIAGEVIAVPSLAGLIERGTAREEVKPVVARAVEEALHRGAEILSLSCTHFPFVRSAFEEVLREKGSSVEIFDPAESVAEEALRRFDTKGEGLPPACAGMAQAGKLLFFISKESPVFRSYAEKLFSDSPFSIEIAPSIYWSLKTV